MKDSPLTVPSPCSAVMLTVSASLNGRTVRGYLTAKKEPTIMLAFSMSASTEVRLHVDTHPAKWSLWIGDAAFDLRAEDVDRIATHLGIVKPELSTEVPA
jgi:hypothetical protein